MSEESPSLPVEKPKRYRPLATDESLVQDTTVFALTKTQKKRLVLKLRVQGWSLRDIAEHVDFRTTYVSYIIQQEIERLNATGLNDAKVLREVENQRLDEYLRRLWPQISGKNSDGSDYQYRKGASSSVARAVEVALKISERRAKLWGLDAPVVTANFHALGDLEGLTHPELVAEAQRLGLIIPMPRDLPHLLPGETDSPPLEERLGD